MPCFITSARVILSLHQPHFLLVSYTHPIGFECPHPPPRIYKGPTCHLSYVHRLFLYLFFFPWIKSNHYLSWVHCNKNPPQKGSFWSGSKAAYHDLSQTPQKWELCALWEWSKSCVGNFQHYPKNSYWNSQRIQKYITQFLATFIFHTRTTNPTFTKFKKKKKFKSSNPHLHWRPKCKGKNRNKQYKNRYLYLCSSLKSISCTCFALVKKSAATTTTKNQQNFQKQ